MVRASAILPFRSAPITKPRVPDTRSRHATWSMNHTRTLGQPKSSMMTPALRDAGRRRYCRHGLWRVGVGFTEDTSFFSTSTGVTARGVPFNEARLHGLKPVPELRSR